MPNFLERDLKTNQLERKTELETLQASLGSHLDRIYNTFPTHEEAEATLENQLSLCSKVCAFAKLAYWLDQQEHTAQSWARWASWHAQVVELQTVAIRSTDQTGLEDQELERLLIDYLFEIGKVAEALEYITAKYVSDPQRYTVAFLHVIAKLRVQGQREQAEELLEKYPELDCEVYGEKYFREQFEYTIEQLKHLSPADRQKGLLEVKAFLMNLIKSIDYRTTGMNQDESFFSMLSNRDSLKQKLKQVERKLKVEKWAQLSVNDNFQVQVKDLEMIQYLFEAGYEEQAILVAQTFFTQIKEQSDQTSRREQPIEVQTQVMESLANLMKYLAIYVEKYPQFQVIFADIFSAQPSRKSFTKDFHLWLESQPKYRRPGWRHMIMESLGDAGQQAKFQEFSLFETLNPEDSNFLIIYFRYLLKFDFQEGLELVNFFLDTEAQRKVVFSFFMSHFDNKQIPQNWQAGVKLLSELDRRYLEETQSEILRNQDVLSDESEVGYGEAVLVFSQPVDQNSKNSSQLLVPPILIRCAQEAIEKKRWDIITDVLNHPLMTDEKRAEVLVLLAA